MRLYGMPGAQSCLYGDGLLDSASGMNPISTSGFIFRSTYVSKMRSTIVQSYFGRPDASSV